MGSKLLDSGTAHWTSHTQILNAWCKYSTGTEQNMLSTSTTPWNWTWMQSRTRIVLGLYSNSFIIYCAHHSEQVWAFHAELMNSSTRTSTEAPVLRSSLQTSCSTYGLTMWPSRKVNVHLTSRPPSKTGLSVTTLQVLQLPQIPTQPPRPTPPLHHHLILPVMKPTVVSTALVLILLVIILLEMIPSPTHPLGRKQSLRSMCVFQNGVSAQEMARSALAAIARVCGRMNTMLSVDPCPCLIPGPAK